MLYIYTGYRWETISPQRKKKILQETYENNLEVWKAPDGAIAFATFQDMEEHAESTEDTEWVCISELYYREFKNE